MMMISANLLSEGCLLKVGRNKYEILKVKNDIGLTRVMYRTNKGIVKTKSYGANDQVKVW